MCGKPLGYELDSSHVVSWLLEQTCQANEHLQNLYIAQGIDFCRRTDAEWKHMKLFAERSQREAYLSVIRQPERQTLQQLYGVVTDTQSSSPDDMSSSALKNFIKELNIRRRAARGNGNSTHSSVLEEVEQEREIELQVEEVRQVQKPTHYEALKFPGLNKVVSQFATTGKLLDTIGCEHVFEVLAHTSVGQKYNVCRTKSRLFVSGEFMRTIELNRRAVNDNFVVSSYHTALSA